MFRKRLQFETLEDRRVCALVFGDGSANKELAKDFSYVGWVEHVQDGVNSFNGNAVLITPHWVLMSAHQALDVDTDRSTQYDSFTVGFGPNYFTNKGEFQTATEVFLNPTYRDVAKGFDLALLYFRQPFTSTPPVAMHSGPIEIGMMSSITGFGKFQDFNDPIRTQTLTGDRYAGVNLVVSLTDPLRPGYVGTQICPAHL